MPELDQFTKAYIEAALWSSSAEQAPHPDASFQDIGLGVTDIAPETLTRMVDDCAAFQGACGKFLTNENLTDQTEYAVTDHAGHDFWLTRNHHRCGFWDGDWAEPAATVLTNASHRFGEIALYLGDDGKIYA
jgi:hypothetical protein